MCVYTYNTLSIYLSFHVLDIHLSLCVSTWYVEPQCRNTCMCVCIYIHVYMYMYMHVYIHVY